MSKSIKNRLLQLMWGSIGMGLACGMDYMGQNLGLFSLPSEIVVIVGVIIPVITKGIRNWIVENAQLP